ncbi:hypothetical protein ABZT47_39630 [Sphaerisporangium sp. NPDC005289]|uniref:hypothetical protein n=1 Tax=Sphaerisporangium sp. NPDC005289 TaxID=3155247 RepID=UPI0033B00E2A
MSSPDTTGWNDSARDASLSHLPDHIRRAIEITPAAGTSERIIDITTLGRRTGRPCRIEIFFYRAAGATYLCPGQAGPPAPPAARNLAHQRPAVSAHAAPPARRPSIAVMCPHTGRARLGYDRAWVLLDQYTGLDLHQLRHSAATDLGDAEVPRRLIMGKTRHRSDAVRQTRR